MLKHEPDTFTIHGIITETKGTSLTIKTANQDSYIVQIPFNTSTTFKVHDSVEVLGKSRILETYPVRIEQVLSIKKYTEKSSTP